MRKFKTTKIDEEAFNKKFEKDLNEIKEKIHAEKTSDEFKQNLQNILEEELNKTSIKNERKIHFPVAMRKLAFACACLIVIFSSCITFADDIENVIFKIFGNTDKVVEEAIANGNYKKIDMEYVEDNGVSIKVDYIVVKENELYIAFNILVDEICEKFYLEDIIFKNQDNYIFYNKKGSENNPNIILEENRIDKYNFVLISKITELNEKFINLTNLKIEIKEIKCLDNNNVNYKKGLWEFDFNIK